MFRKYVIITLATLLFVGGVGCTSHKADDDSADVESSSMDGLETGDAVENNSDLDMGSATADASGDSTDSGAIADLGTDDLSADEALPDDSGAAVTDNSVAGGDISETPPADTTNLDAPPPTEMAESAPPMDSPAPDDSQMAMDSGSSSDTTLADNAPPEPSVAEPMDAPVADTSSASEEAPRPVVGSLKKINTSPYRQGKFLVNAVYVARKGDSVASIAQKVLGSSKRKKEICKINAYNCSRDTKVGDKYYYNSPQRPNDDTTVKTFYEDAGVAPEMYTAKSGDNIRKVGKELLGDSRSWMELWATNDVESKGDLDEGTQLKYWPTSEVAAPAVASNEAAPAQEEAAPAPEAEQPNEQEAPIAENTPPPQDMAMNTPPPPPPMEESLPPPPPQDGSLPPPPDQNMAAGAATGAAAGTIEPPPPPPPPPPMDTAQPPVQAGGEDLANPDQTMALGVGAILLLAAAALFISIRKRKQRRAIDFNTSTQTQIE